MIYAWNNALQKHPEPATVRRPHHWVDCMRPLKGTHFGSRASNSGNSMIRWCLLNQRSRKTLRLGLSDQTVSWCALKGGVWRSPKAMAAVPMLIAACHSETTPAFQVSPIASGWRIIDDQRYAFYTVKTASWSICLWGNNGHIYIQYIYIYIYGDCNSGPSQFRLHQQLQLQNLWQPNDMSTSMDR